MRNGLWVISNQFLSVYKYPLYQEISSNVDKIIRSSEESDIETARKLLNDGVDVNSKNKGGWSVGFLIRTSGNGQSSSCFLKRDP